MTKFRLFIFLAAIMFLVIETNAQLQGVIEYGYTIDMHRNIPAEREDFRAMIPRYHEQKFSLVFSDKESLFKVIEDADAAMNMGRGGMRMTMRMPTSVTYVDRVKKEVLVQQDLLGKNYLISEPLLIGPWRVGNETMEIAGYMCLMAWKVDSITNQEITAWFTPEIGPFLGPDRYVSLPGTVLALDINNGERVWVAREIDLQERVAAEINAPSRGERISRTEFNKLMREQTERMRSRGMAFPF